jgi:alanine racemase
MITEEREVLEYFRVYANVDLDQIKENALNMKAQLKPGTRFLAVIKADGYGHGAIPIAKTLNGVADWFATATVEEALSLRRHGICEPILILGYAPAYCYKEMITNEIRPAVYTYEMAVEISQMAVSLKKEASIHIKVDTGMGRIGFFPNEESVRTVARIAKLPNIKIEGIFTHFAKADEEDKSHADWQFKRFTSFISGLEQAGVKPEICHCANSATILDMPEKYLDMVRAGITLYGLKPSMTEDIHKLNIKPALSLYSHVVYVKEVPAGTTVSYGGTFCADRTTKVATIPVGYADGYPRSLSNIGHVLIHGRKAPILGRVCMDQMMVDVTHIPEAKMGSRVTLIGKDGTEEITTDWLGEVSKRFNYELVCDLGKRIPRVYYVHGTFAGTKDYFSL